MVYILIAILIFGFLIFIHELGHFISAKLLDVLAQVKEVIRQEQEEKEKALQEEEAAGSQEDTAQKGVSDSNG